MGEVYVLCESEHAGTVSRLRPNGIDEMYVRCDKVIAKHNQHTGSFSHTIYVCIYAYMLLQSADFFPRFPFMWCVECVCEHM